MKVKKLLNRFKIGQYIQIYDYTMSIQYSGFVCDINIFSHVMDEKVESIWLDDYLNAICIKYR